jgi:penicillin-binding protein 1C
VSIAYPGNGSIIALDPDIPDQVQRVRFTMRPEVEGYRWLLNGAELDGDAGAMFWRPATGTNTLTLLDRDGNPVDRVTFEVRGTITSPGDMPSHQATQGTTGAQ